MRIDDPNITKHRKCKTNVISPICGVMTGSISIRDDFISKFIEIFIAFEEIDIVEIFILLLGDNKSVGWYAVRNFVFELDEFVDNQII
jgi:hypothetical protein